VTELRAALEAKDTETEEYLAELEEVGNAYESMRVQNARLLEQLRDKEDSNTRLVSEKIKAKQIESLLRSKNDALQRNLRALEKAKEVAQQVQVKLDAQLKSAMDQSQNLLASEQLVNTLVESHKNSARDALQLFNNSRNQLEAKQSAFEDVQNRAKISSEQVLQKTAEHQRLSEDVTSLTKKLDYYQKIHTKGKSSKHNSAAENELLQIKSLISCPIQNDQRIGMDQFCVIAKCWHVFSRAGINTNIANRNRKCPSCGQKFDNSDAKDIFLTN